MLRILRQYYPIRNVVFAAGEGAIILAAVLLACWIKIGSLTPQLDPSLFFKSLTITFICQMSLYYSDLYNFKITRSLTEQMIRLLQALGLTSIIFGVIYLFAPGLMITQGLFLIIVSLVVVMIFTWRIGYAFILDKGLFDQKIVLIGDGELSQSIFQEIEEKKDSGYQITQYIDLSKLIVEKKSENGLPIDPNTKTSIRKIVVALEEKRGKLPVKELLRCRTAGIEIIDGTTFYEMLTGKLHVTQINPSWLIFSDGFRKSGLQRFFKRTGDVVLSVLFLILLAPLMLLTAFLIRLDSEGPVFFSQDRVGRSRKPFRVIKFRSMVENAESGTGPVWALDNDSRVTRVGRWIRKLRIDELPQIWNVLRGEMSFVGPRPEREFFVRQLEEKVPYYGERFNVKPGITGWAQVSYGYGASVDDAIEKLNYDLFYIKNLTFLLDLLIIIRTVKIVLLGKGAR
ncbi:MAG: TIGR03013 family XrtA/PEP-CTERM system glycosyltransferase [Desulfobacterales bacterium]